MTTFVIETLPEGRRDALSRAYNSSPIWKGVPSDTPERWILNAIGAALQGDESEVEIDTSTTPPYHLRGAVLRLELLGRELPDGWCLTKLARTIRAEDAVANPTAIPFGQ